MIQRKLEDMPRCILCKGYGDNTMLMAVSVKMLKDLLYKVLINIKKK